MTHHTSLIWKIPTKELLQIVSQATSISEILSHFGLMNKGNNYCTLKKRLIEDNIDYSHIKLGKGSNRNRKFVGCKQRRALHDILVENSTYKGTLLKKRLLSEGLLDNKCYICGQLPVWHNNPLSLQLDHINGISNDNRIENLRILCPHCHSQTPTFAGRNKSGPRKVKPSIINPNWRKDPRPERRKVNRPSKIELEKLLWEKPTSQIAEEFGVSDHTISKWAKSYGLSKPPRGYWSKLKSMNNYI